MRSADARIGKEIRRRPGNGAELLLEEAVEDAKRKKPGAWIDRHPGARFSAVRHCRFF